MLPLLHRAELVQQKSGANLHEVPWLSLLVLLPQLYCSREVVVQRSEVVAGRS